MIKVLIVDAIKILRDCLRLAIEQDERFEVVGCAGDGKEAVELTSKLNPDVILMDLYMPVYSGFDAIRDIKALNNKIKILALTVENDENDMTQAFVNGADGYALKDIGLKELMAALLNIYNGIRFIHESAFNLDDDNTSIDPAQRDDATLRVSFTAREKDVLKLVVAGKTNEEISGILGISVGRARNIVTDLISKCMVKNRTQLAVLAVKMMMLTSGNQRTQS